MGNESEQAGDEGEGAEDGEMGWGARCAGSAVCGIEKIPASEAFDHTEKSMPKWLPRADFAPRTRVAFARRGERQANAVAGNTPLSCDGKNRQKRRDGGTQRVTAA
jgi:hypothetical protein